jgi:8-oxo-dGTP pyrophosphatase MutT (NUDIX family)
MKSLLEILEEGKNKMESVGIILIARDTNRFLLLHRTNTPIVWSLLSGKMDKKGEKPYDTILREIQEETGINPNDIDDISKVGMITAKGKKFHVFVGYVPFEYNMPNLDKNENDDYGWFNEDNLPSPLHYRWDKTFQLVKPLLSLRESIKRNLKKLLYGK